MATDAKTNDIISFIELDHHSHTPRKKWTHYFWEFFMFFLDACHKAVNLLKTIEEEYYLK